MNFNEIVMFLNWLRLFDMRIITNIEYFFIVPLYKRGRPKFFFVCQTYTLENEKGGMWMMEEASKL